MSSGMVSGDAMARRASDVDDANEGTAKALKKQTRQQRVRRKISFKARLAEEAQLILINTAVAHADRTFRAAGSQHEWAFGRPGLRVP